MNREDYAEHVARLKLIERATATLRVIERLTLSIIQAIEGGVKRDRQK